MAQFGSESAQRLSWIMLAVAVVLCIVVFQVVGGIAGALAGVAVAAVIGLLGRYLITKVR